MRCFLLRACLTHDLLCSKRAHSARIPPSLLCRPDESDPIVPDERPRRWRRRSATRRGASSAPSTSRCRRRGRAASPPSPTATTPRSSPPSSAASRPSRRATPPTHAHSHTQTHPPQTNTLPSLPASRLRSRGIPPSLLAPVSGRRRRDGGHVADRVLGDAPRQRRLRAQAQDRQRGVN